MVLCRGKEKEFSFFVTLQQVDDGGRFRLDPCVRTSSHGGEKSQQDCDCARGVKRAVFDNAEKESGVKAEKKTQTRLTGIISVVATLLC